MNDSKKVLESMLSTVQMGQMGIRSVLGTAVRVDLKTSLQSQLKEYDAVETQAHAIAASRSWELKELNPAISRMAGIMSRLKLMGQRPDSKIAAMMIQGNTRGMIIGLKDRHRYPNVDGEVDNLSQRLLDLEQENIRQMKPYL